MNTNLEMHGFATGADEAQWWFDHREETADLLEQAVAEGRTTSLAAILEKRRQRGSAIPAVSLRLDAADWERARSQAQRRGLAYQAYLKIVLHDALEREDQRMEG